MKSKLSGRYLTGGKVVLACPSSKIITGNSCNKNEAPATSQSVPVSDSKRECRMHTSAERLMSREALLTSSQIVKDNTTELLQQENSYTRKLGDGLITEKT